MINIRKYLTCGSKFSLNSTNLGRFQNIPNVEDSYYKNYSKKTTKILRKTLRLRQF